MEYVWVLCSIRQRSQILRKLAQLKVETLFTAFPDRKRSKCEMEDLEARADKIPEKSIRPSAPRHPAGRNSPASSFFTLPPHQLGLLRLRQNHVNASIPKDQLNNISVLCLFIIVIFLKIAPAFFVTMYDSCPLFNMFIFVKIAPM